MVLINRSVDEKINCPLSGLPERQPDKQVVRIVCCYAGGYTVKGLCVCCVQAERMRLHLKDSSVRPPGGNGD